VSEAHFPARGTLPDNLEFGLWNFYEPPPSHLQGSFDIVHVRFVVGAIRSSDPGQVLDHLIQLLKPDGILQWDEGPIAEAPLKYPAGHSSDAFVDVLNTIASKTGAKAGIGTWVGKLGLIFQEHGLHLVEEKRGGEVKREMWKYWAQMQIVGSSYFARLVRNRENVPTKLSTRLS
jgi:hypothetical protein